MGIQSEDYQMFSFCFDPEVLNLFWGLLPRGSTGDSLSGIQPNYLTNVTPLKILLPSSIISVQNNFTALQCTVVASGLFIMSSYLGHRMVRGLRSASLPSLNLRRSGSSEGHLHIFHRSPIRESTRSALTLPLSSIKEPQRNNNEQILMGEEEEDDVEDLCPQYFGPHQNELDDPHSF